MLVLRPTLIGLKTIRALIIICEAKSSQPICLFCVMTVSTLFRIFILIISTIA